MASRGIVRRLARDRTVLIVLLLAALAAGYLVWRSLGTRAASLTITAGRQQGLRHVMAEELAEGAASNRVKLRIVPTAGSEAALDAIEAGRIDLALVQGGLDLGGRQNVRQVAALHVEALHVLVKAELAESAGRGLDALKGRRVNLGEEGSGTRVLAAEVLRFVGLNPDTDYRPEGLSYDQLNAETKTEALPDAIFMVSLLPSSVARHLVVRHGYRLVGLPFGEAFSLNGRGGGDPGSAASRGSIDRDHVVETVIPAFTYGVMPSVPPESLRTMGTRMLLVANRRVDPDAVARLIETAFNTPFAQLAHPKLSASVLELPNEFPPHPGLVVYQERSKPLITGDVIDSIEKEVSIGGAVLGAAFFLWQWLKVRFRRMRETGFEHYILRVAEIEEHALKIELGETLDLPGLLALQDDLGRTRADAIARFASGELEGEDLLSGFLAQASNARDYLTRLILHRRDDLERRARKEKRDATLLWREALSGTSDPVTPPANSPPTSEQNLTEIR